MNITITKEEYFRLKRSEMALNLLEIGGVDNWEWYSESLNPDGEDDFDTREAKLKKEIFEKNETTKETL